SVRWATFISEFAGPGYGGGTAERCRAATDFRPRRHGRLFHRALAAAMLMSAPENGEFDAPYANSPVRRDCPGNACQRRARPAAGRSDRSPFRRFGATGASADGCGQI